MQKLGHGLQEITLCIRCPYRLNLWKRHQPQHRKTFQPARYFAVDQLRKQEHAIATGRAETGDFQDAPASSSDTSRAEGEVEEGLKVQNGDISQNIPGSPNITYEIFEGPTSRILDQIKSREKLRTKKRLEYNRLGEPADVLVLPERRKERDEIDTYYGPPASDTDQTLAEAMTSSEVLEEIDAERGVIDRNQVIRNIDGLIDDSIRDLNLIWQTIGIVIPVENYDHIASKLYDGFTASQLAAYLAYTTRVFPVDPLDLHNKFSTALYTRSPWTPGTSDIWRVKTSDVTDISEDESHQTGRSSRGKQSTAGSNKATFVEEILRRCWRIRPEEDESALGEMEMRLQAAHLELIVKHKRGILKQLSETYGSKVEASTIDRALRITSDYETCVDILRLIIQTISNINSQEVDFPIEHQPKARSMKARSMGPQAETYGTFVREVMQSTNTIIEPVTSQVIMPRKGQSKEFSRMIIHSLGPDDEEDVAEARRLISQVLRKIEPKDRTVVAGQALRERRDLLVPIDVGSGLSLTDRSRQWCRWSSRSMRGIDRRAETDANSSRLDTVQNPLDQQQVHNALNRFLVIKDKKRRTSENTRRYWIEDVIYQDSAILGHVVFPTPKNEADRTSASPTSHLSGLQPRLTKIHTDFVTQVPGLVSLVDDIGLENPHTKTRDEELLVIRLFPSSKNILLPQIIKAMPDLEIRIICDDKTKTTQIQKVSLVRREELGLLLPQNTVDLHFTHERCIHARSGSIDPSIELFIQNSNLDIWGPGRLKTPTDLTLSIPPHALGNVNDPSFTAKLKKNELQYTFASLEHRSEMEIPFSQPKSHAELTYTTIEAGKIGGRRNELSLRQSRLASKRVESDVDVHQHKDEPYTASLLKKANALIHKLENPSDPNAAKSRPKFPF